MYLKSKQSVYFISLNCGNIIQLCNITYMIWVVYNIIELIIYVNVVIYTQ